MVIEIIEGKTTLYLNGVNIAEATLPSDANQEGKIRLYKYWERPDLTYSDDKVRVP